MSAPLTVRAAIELYKTDPERSGVASKTRAAWEFRFRAIEELLGPDRLIGAIRREDVRACRDAMLKLPANAAKHFPGRTLHDAIRLGEARGLPQLSAKSVNLYVELLSSLFKWLEREEMVARNPAKGLKGPPQPSEKPRRPLTASEINALLAVTQIAENTVQRWSYWMVRNALLSGMRLGEIAGLTAGDVAKINPVAVFSISTYLTIPRSITTVKVRRPVNPPMRLRALTVPKAA